jgi:hypothetical protein
MRTTLLSALIIVVGVAALAQAATTPTSPITRVAAEPYGPNPPHANCCREKLWDRNGKLVGDLLEYNNSYGPQQMIGYVSYRIPGGDAVVLQATPDALYGLQAPGGSNTLFTAPNCSGTTMFAAIAWPPLAKRYAMVLLEGGGSWPTISAAHAWLWVTDPLPARALPSTTVFHSQWYDNQTCQAYPAPGYTIPAGSGPGGFWMHRVEDIYAKFKRPFFVNY